VTAGVTFRTTNLVSTFLSLEMTESYLGMNSPHIEKLKFLLSTITIPKLSCS